MHVHSDIPIQNYLTGEMQILSPADQRFVATPAQIDQIVNICNQPQVYSILFHNRLNGVPYGREDAERFIAWAERGWVDQTHFVFLILAPQPGSIAVVGSLDIKSSTLRSAEIGYWLDSERSGVMTNGVKELVKIARAQGYRELFARVRADNARSARVLTRAGFDVTDRLVDQNTDYMLFSMTL